MTNDFLKEYIELILNERKKFDRYEMEKLRNWPWTQRLSYVWFELGLPQIGKGSSRVVFRLDSKRVLKMAINNKGLAQNQAEIDVVTNPKLSPIFAKIYDYGSDYSWLISELVRPLKSSREFEDLTGLSEFFFLLMDNLRTPNKEKQEQQIQRWLESHPNNLFFNGIIQAIKIGKLKPGDIALEHLGKTSNGRVVLLDYGLTDDVYSKHYS